MHDSRNSSKFPTLENIIHLITTFTALLSSEMKREIPLPVFFSITFFFVSYKAAFDRIQCILVEMLCVKVIALHRFQTSR